MSSYERIQFKHVIIDTEGPIDPHIKAVGDMGMESLRWLSLVVKAGLWFGTSIPTFSNT